MATEHFYDPATRIFVPVGSSPPDASVVNSFSNRLKAEERRLEADERRHLKLLNARRKRVLAALRRKGEGPTRCVDPSVAILIARGEEECKRNKLLNERRSNSSGRGGYVYVIQDRASGLYKIGRTRNLNRRLKQLGVGATASLVSASWSADAAATEKSAHHRYKASRLPHAEYFILSHPPSV
jgi:hypothetical protein